MLAPETNRKFESQNELFACLVDIAMMEMVRKISDLSRNQFMQVVTAIQPPIGKAAEVMWTASHQWDSDDEPALKAGYKKACAFLSDMPGGEETRTEILARLTKIHPKLTML